MKRVITYGTYDLLHFGHIRLLERAKSLGDYLIVGVTADDFDKTRGKINVQWSLIERIEAIRETGLADEIIIEEYEGQKIDDIKRYSIDIFAIGSDWKGKFDYLKEYCDVIYLDRTQGISSTEIRSDNKSINLGLIGESNIVYKYIKESKYINGLNIGAIYVNSKKIGLKNIKVVSSYSELLKNCDAVYIVSHPKKHYTQIKKALLEGKHVICELPITLEIKKTIELYELAKNNNLVLFGILKTAFSTAYNRLLLLIKSGKIGTVVSIDTTSTSLEKNIKNIEYGNEWSSYCAWGPTNMLPVFQLLGTNYRKRIVAVKYQSEENNFDAFSKVNYIYNNAIATFKVAKGIKSEGEMIISGTKGYVYVPSPWWKMDYFEIRYENHNDNKRYFYPLDGEGIRYMLLAFYKLIVSNKNNTYIEKNVIFQITKEIEDFYNKKDIIKL